MRIERINIAATLLVIYSVFAVIAGIYFLIKWMVNNG
jgi:hypothetical protein